MDQQSDLTTDRPDQVRGSVTVAPDAARWRPDLVTTFDDSGLTLLDRHHRDDTGLYYCVYTEPESDRGFLRVDDGHRFVGVEVLWSELEASGPSDAFRRLERELTDPRRLTDEVPCQWCVNRCEPGCGCTCWGVSTDEAPSAFAAIGQWARQAQETQEGERAVLSGGPDPRAEGTVLWMPEPPADPEAPTPAELAGGINLTPDLGPADGVYESPTGRRMIVGTSEVVSFDRASDGGGGAIRRVGERIVAAGAGAIVAYSMLPETVRRAIEAELQREQLQQNLRAVCTDEAMYERALAAAEERDMSVRQLFEAVAVGRYIDSGWAEWSCSIDVDPTGTFPPPNYARLDHGMYQLWCSLPDEAKVAALRAARDLATVSRCRQERALVMVLATRR